MSELTADQLLGTWELVDFRVEASDGRPARYPFGPNARGRILYAPDGHMTAVLSRDPTNRRSGALASLETSHRSAPEDKSAAFDSYLSYSGRWRLDGEQVHHDIDLALVPGVVGHTQIGDASLEDGVLRRQYSRCSRSGTIHTFVLRWMRPGACR